MNGSTVIPTLRYRDADAAIEWLCDTFGFAKNAVYPGPENTVAHAQLTMGTGMIMLGSATNSGTNPEHWAHPDEIGRRVTTPVYIVVPDCKPVYERAKAAGAEFLMELQTMEYGGQAFAVRDPEGYAWSFGEYDPWAHAPEAGTEKEAA